MYPLILDHPFYLDTRYFDVDESTGERTLITTQNTTADGNYESWSHGVYLRNAHGMEALMLPTNLTWRSLGGSIDLYVFDGPTQDAVTKQYQLGAIGLPAMQQYFTFGFHQCRWGYKNWSMVEDVVNTYRAFDIPLENVWTDIDYMFQYRVSHLLEEQSRRAWSLIGCIGFHQRSEHFPIPRRTGIPRTLACKRPTLHPHRRLSDLYPEPEQRFGQLLRVHRWQRPRGLPQQS